MLFRSLHVRPNGTAAGGLDRRRSNSIWPRRALQQLAFPEGNYISRSGIVPDGRRQSCNGLPVSGGRRLARSKELVSTVVPAGLFGWVGCISPVEQSLY